ncbi:hypothetical protein [Escherichia coli]
MKNTFSSRDSRVIFDVYNYIDEEIYNQQLPKGIYFYISRTATLSAYKNKALRGTLLSLYNSKLNVKNFLDYVFNIDVSNDKIAKKLVQELKLNLSSDSNESKKKFLTSYINIMILLNVIMK